MSTDYPFGTWLLVAAAAAAAALSYVLQSPILSARHGQAQYSHGVHLVHALSHALQNIAPVHSRHSQRIVRLSYLAFPWQLCWCTLSSKAAQYHAHAI